MEVDRAVEQSIGLALSGGGFRATLFHTGVLMRLNATGVLPRLERISSVSGGSIAAGALAVAWTALRFDNDGVATNFADVVLKPVMELATRRIDVPAVLCGAMIPGRSAAQQVAAALDRQLFDGRTLQDLPERPRFVFNATNLDTGSLVRFSRPYLADYRVGMVTSPEVRLSEAVAASAAFPPFLAPLVLRIPVSDWTDMPGNTHGGPVHRRRLALVDGGVYDNMALEALWKRCTTIIASDAGSPLRISSRPRRTWPVLLNRVIQVVDSQVRAQRRRALVESFGRDADGHAGCLVLMTTPLSRYPTRDGSEVGDGVVAALSRLPTRLTRVSRGQQERLVNWGFRAAEAAVGSYLMPGLPALPFPFPGRPMTE